MSEICEECVGYVRNVCDMWRMSGMCWKKAPWSLNGSCGRRCYSLWLTYNNENAVPNPQNGYTIRRAVKVDPYFHTFPHLLKVSHISERCGAAPSRGVAKKGKTWLCVYAHFTQCSPIFPNVLQFYVIVHQFRLWRKVIKKWWKVLMIYAGCGDKWSRSDGKC